MTTTKEERLAKLEAEAKALREEIEAEKNAKKYTHPHVFVPEAGERYSYLFERGGGALLDGGLAGWLASNGADGYSPAFRSGEIAQQYAEAHNVELECRKQLGACVFKLDGSAQWTIVLEHTGKVVAKQCLFPSSFQFGCFESEEAAKAAIKAVGENRIRAAAFTKAGVV